ncbi:hypothetical protein BH18VER1_BH18VER1_06830 [soil metagenome]
MQDLRSGNSISLCFGKLIEGWVVYVRYGSTGPLVT